MIIFDRRLPVRPPPFPSLRRTLLAERVGGVTTPLGKRLFGATARSAAAKLHSREVVLAAVANVRSSAARGIGVLIMTTERLIFIDAQWVQQRRMSRTLSLAVCKNARTTPVISIPFATITKLTITNEKDEHTIAASLSIGSDVSFVSGGTAALATLLAWMVREWRWRRVERQLPSGPPSASALYDHHGAGEAVYDLEAVQSKSSASSRGEKQKKKKKKKKEKEEEEVDWLSRIDESVPRHQERPRVSHEESVPLFDGISTPTTTKSSQSRTSLKSTSMRRKQAQSDGALGTQGEATRAVSERVAFNFTVMSELRRQGVFVEEEEDRNLSSGGRDHSHPYSSRSSIASSATPSQSARAGGGGGRRSVLRTNGSFGGSSAFVAPQKKKKKKETTRSSPERHAVNDGTSRGGGEELAFRRAHSGWRGLANVFCETYPSHIAVPTAISPSELVEVVKHRSKARIPALSYIHPTNGAALCRCAQPRAGAGLSRTVATTAHGSMDERMLRAIAFANAFCGYRSVRGDCAVGSESATSTAGVVGAGAAAARSPPSSPGAGAGAGAAGESNLTNQHTDLLYRSYVRRGGERERGGSAAVHHLPHSDSISRAHDDGHTGGASTTAASLLIVDCRGWQAATANMVFKGKGYEDPTHLMATNDHSNALCFGGLSSIPRADDAALGSALKLTGHHSGGSTLAATQASKANVGDAAALAAAAARASYAALTPQPISLIAKVRFMNISNIHTMRASRHRLSNSIDLRACTALEDAIDAATTPFATSRFVEVESSSSDEEDQDDDDEEEGMTSNADPLSFPAPPSSTAKANIKALRRMRGAEADLAAEDDLAPVSAATFAAGRTTDPTPAQATRPMPNGAAGGTPALTSRSSSFTSSRHLHERHERNRSRSDFEMLKALVGSPISAPLLGRTSTSASTTAAAAVATPKTMMKKKKTIAAMMPPSSLRRAGVTRTSRSGSAGVGLLGLLGGSPVAGALAQQHTPAESGGDVTGNKMSDESANESLVIGGSFALPTPPREHEEGVVQLPRKTTAGDHDAAGVDDDATTSFAQQQSVNDDVAAPKTRTTAEVEAERDAAAVGTNATPLALLPQHDNPHAHLPPGLGGGDAHALERRLKAAVGLAVESLNASGMPSVQADGGEAWINALNKSQWLTHLSRLLRASLATASALHSGTTCVVHCSDGWDRTSQVTSLAQLLISPYYRSFRGFAALIEKDWCGFGHKFADRCLSLGEEHSPIFAQWIDAVNQLLLQFPTSFEFTEAALRFLVHAAHSGKYQTFACNSSVERAAQAISSPKRGAAGCALSAWDVLLPPLRRRRVLSESDGGKDHYVLSTSSSTQIESPAVGCPSSRSSSAKVTRRERRRQRRQRRRYQRMSRLEKDCRSVRLHSPYINERYVGGAEAMAQGDGRAAKLLVPRCAVAALSLWSAVHSSVGDAEVIRDSVAAAAAYTEEDRIAERLAQLRARSERSRRRADVRAARAKSGRACVPGGAAESEQQKAHDRSSSSSSSSSESESERSSGQHDGKASDSALEAHLAQFLTDPDDLALAAPTHQQLPRIPPGAIVETQVAEAIVHPHRRYESITDVRLIALSSEMKHRAIAKRGFHESHSIDGTAGSRKGSGRISTGYGYAKNGASGAAMLTDAERLLAPLYAALPMVLTCALSHRGTLMKRSRWVGAWRKRYFELRAIGGSGSAGGGGSNNACTALLLLSFKSERSLDGVARVGTIGDLFATTMANATAGDAVNDARAAANGNATTAATAAISAMALQERVITPRNFWLITRDCEITNSSTSRALTMQITRVHELECVAVAPPQPLTASTATASGGVAFSARSSGVGVQLDFGSKSDARAVVPVSAQRMKTTRKSEMEGIFGGGEGGERERVSAVGRKTGRRKARETTSKATDGDGASVEAVQLLSMACLKHHRFRGDSPRTVLLYRISSPPEDDLLAHALRSGTNAQQTHHRSNSTVITDARQARTILMTRDTVSGRETNRWSMSAVIGCEVVGGEVVLIHTRSATSGAERRLQFTPAEEGALRRCTSAAVLVNAVNAAIEHDRSRTRRLAARNGNRSRSGSLSGRTRYRDICVSIIKRFCTICVFCILLTNIIFFSYLISAVALVAAVPFRCRLQSQTGTPRCVATVHLQARLRQEQELEQKQELELELPAWMQVCLCFKIF